LTLKTYIKNPFYDINSDCFLEEEPLSFPQNVKIREMLGMGIKRVGAGLKVMKEKKELQFVS